jgi:hypothetical protein
MGPAKKSKHAAGDELFKNASPEAKKVHDAFKKSMRHKERTDWMRQRQAQNSQFTP